MLKINKDYSDYTDETDSNYPEGKGINASTAESVDGTPWLASFMNNIVGALQGMYKRAYGNTTGIDGKEDSVNKSQFVEAVEKFTDDKIIEHEAKRGLVDGIHGATAEAVGGQLVTRDEFGSAEFSTPLTNAAAARRGDIYDLTRAVVCSTEESNFAKEIENKKLPGFILQNEAQIKVLFQFGAIKAVEDITDADVLTLNCCRTGAKKIFAKRDGVIIPLGSHDIDGKRSYFQSYTDLSLIYLEALDEGNGGWLILGNPVVLSKSSDTEGYTVYADGESKLHNIVYKNQASINLSHLAKYRSSSIYWWRITVKNAYHGLPSIYIGEIEIGSTGISIRTTQNYNISLSANSFIITNTDTGADFSYWELEPLFTNGF